MPESQIETNRISGVVVSDLNLLYIGCVCQTCANLAVISALATLEDSPVKTWIAERPAYDNEFFEIEYLSSAQDPSEALYFWRNCFRFIGAVQPESLPLFKAK